MELDFADVEKDFLKERLEAICAPTIDGDLIESVEVFFIPTNLVMDQTYHAPVTRSMTLPVVSSFFDIYGNNTN